MDLKVEKGQACRIEEQPSDKVHWPRSARVSLWSLLAATICLITSLSAISASITGSGLLDLDIDRPIIFALGILSALLFMASVLTCIVSGFFAVRKCRVVLWWLVPVFLVTLLYCFVMAIAN